MADWKNQLYFGDNLDILRTYVPTAGVDLIYLDPPFNSKATYNVLFAEKSGEASARPRSPRSRTPGAGAWSPRRPTRRRSPKAPVSSPTSSRPCALF